MIQFVFVFRAVPPPQHPECGSASTATHRLTNGAGGGPVPSGSPHPQTAVSQSRRGDSSPGVAPRPVSDPRVVQVPLHGDWPVTNGWTLSSLAVFEPGVLEPGCKSWPRRLSMAGGLRLQLPQRLAPGPRGAPDRMRPAACARWLRVGLSNLACNKWLGWRGPGRDRIRPRRGLYPRGELHTTGSVRTVLHPILPHVFCIELDRYPPATAQTFCIALELVRSGTALLHQSVQPEGIRQN